MTTMIDCSITHTLRKMIENQCLHKNVWGEFDDEIYKYHHPVSKADIFRHSFINNN